MKRRSITVYEIRNAQNFVSITQKEIISKRIKY